MATSLAFLAASASLFHSLYAKKIPAAIAPTPIRIGAIEPKKPNISGIFAESNPKKSFD